MQGSGLYNLTPQMDCAQELRNSAQIVPSGQRRKERSYRIGLRVILRDTVPQISRNVINMPLILR
jgi:hypothetical protein